MEHIWMGRPGFLLAMALVVAVVRTTSYGHEAARVDEAALLRVRKYFPHVQTDVRAYEHFFYRVECIASTSIDGLEVDVIFVGVKQPKTYTISGYGTILILNERDDVLAKIIGLSANLECRFSDGHLYMEDALPLPLTLEGLVMAREGNVGPGSLRNVVARDAVSRVRSLMQGVGRGNDTTPSTTDADIANSFRAMVRAGIRTWDVSPMTLEDVELMFIGATCAFRVRVSVVVETESDRHACRWVVHGPNYNDEASFSMTLLECTRIADATVDSGTQGHRNGPTPRP